MSIAPPPTAVLPEALLPWVWQGAGGLQARAGLGQPVVSSGFPALDAQLPGGGWPRGMVCELLVDEALSCEWRLLLPVLRQVVRRGEPVFLVDPPQPPHAGLHAVLGCPPQRLVWIRTDKPAQAGWACEQVLKSGADAAVLAWLPRIGPAPLRRLQAVAQACMASTLQAGGRDPAGCLLLVVRPAAARAQSSPAPLRVSVCLAGGAESSGGGQGSPGTLADAAGLGRLRLHVLKRRGPLHEAPIELAALDEGLAPVLAGRLARPGGLSAARRGRVPVAAMDWREIAAGIDIDALAAADDAGRPLAASPAAASPADAAQAAPSPAPRPKATVFVLPEVTHAALAGTAPAPI